MIKSKTDGLSGFILPIHMVRLPEERINFMMDYPELIKYLKNPGYEMIKIDELVKTTH